MQCLHGECYARRKVNIIDLAYKKLTKIHLLFFSPHLTFAYSASRFND